MRPVLLALLVAVVGCQAPAPPTPTPTALPPTATVRPPTAIAPPSAVPPPTVAPPPAGSSRVETLNAANAAFTRGDLQTASGLYERVLNTPPTDETAAATEVINGFARFRAMVALLATGREDDAKAHLDELQKVDANAPFARLANQLWDQYGMVGALRGACAQLQPQIASQAGAALRALLMLGVTVDAQSLCSTP